jgi:glyceraldehyde-3-phosphate dehydrogenase/erythrose-4-phosphate dehydrogenase
VTAFRLGINGFGRMGRLALRAGWGAPDLEYANRLVELARLVARG